MNITCGGLPFRQHTVYHPPLKSIKLPVKHGIGLDFSYRTSIGSFWNLVVSTIIF